MLVGHPKQPIVAVASSFLERPSETAHPQPPSWGDIMLDIMERIIVQLPRELLKELDRAAKETKVSRAAFARAAIELALAERQRHHDYAAIIRSYTERPQTQDEVLSSPELIRQAWPD
jgi:Arc/MetJ-type ribon-helix-helix transcriptional regulator